MSEDEQQTPPHCPTCQCQVFEYVEQILDEVSQQLADLWQVLADEVRNTYTATVEALEEVA